MKFCLHSNETVSSKTTRQNIQRSFYVLLCYILVIPTFYSVKVLFYIVYIYCALYIFILRLLSSLVKFIFKYCFDFTFILNFILLVLGKCA